MQRALDLALLGLNTTTPNPRVGCVIVKNDVVVGEGFHEKAGQAHAEVHALQQAGALAHGATAYVTLEPCSHHGRTPPCADALIQAGVAEVVAATTDSNPLVAGQGLARLAAAGIKTRMQRGRPWVRLKVAISLDGFTALPTGESQWITGEAARQDGHAWRARACAILTGIGTIKEDNPLLNVRGINTPRQPIRIIADSRLEIDPSARILNSAQEGGPVWLAHAVDGLEERSTGIGLRHPASALQEKAALLREMGIELLHVPGNSQGKLDLSALLQTLALRGINELHVEAGAKLNASLLNAGCVDELLVYQAPRLLGAGLPFAALAPATSLQHTHDWMLQEHTELAPDLRLRFTKHNPGF
ncbi:MAG: bifunctional diaminohydroxyphosphoribosylaminopyrimidine deaminase/5-amino-6-(5-phosphoribosylamino)uracil reductase RibD [Burkholderiales bacterium]|nr:bifunctional diaminohydroxyphosphoribosylaminopyrimidine deaminase/5-amino-6-(5-phosphoribosylamino)uracil reductase RibD [Burkholderiales bacterium]